MRKFITVLVVLLCITATGLTVSGCSAQNASSGGSNAPSASSSIESGGQGSNALALTTLEAVEDASVKDAEDTVAALTAKYEQLVTEIPSYDVYLDNTDKVNAFYEECVSTTNALCISLQKYALNYAQIVLNSGKSYGVQYDDLEGIYDYIYEDAAKVIYDDIYDGILKEMYDSFYDGILKDAYDNASYGTWSEARSNEYEWWSDARGDVYEEWSDCRSDIYSFWSDLRGDVFGDKMDRAQKAINDYQEDIDKLVAKSS